MHCAAILHVIVSLGFLSSLKRSSSSCDMKATVRGNLTSGRAFESGCICHSSSAGLYNDLVGRTTECQCGAPRLYPQSRFVDVLMNIGKQLSTLPTKERRGELRCYRKLLLGDAC